MRRLTVMMLVTGLVLAACGGDDDSGGDEAGDVVLITHESFAVSDEVRALLDEAAGGLADPLAAGDTGALTSQLVLAAGNPPADVVFGIDSTMLTRAVEAGVFEPYRSPELDSVPEEITSLIPDDLVTPIDTGEVCVNADRRWYAERSLAVPQTLDDLIDPAYAGQLVVMDPATSSPGLAFLLATIARYGDGWQDWWQALVANDVEVASGWQEAYDASYSAGSSASGDRPMMVSYASSPPAELIFAADPKPTEPYSVVLTDSCYRQVEFAGVLRGTKRPERARALIDAMLSAEFQADVPGQMFVFPVREGVELPAEFSFVERPAQPLELPPDEVAANQATWIEQWSDIVLG